MFSMKHRRNTKDNKRNEKKKNNVINATKKRKNKKSSNCNECCLEPLTGTIEMGNLNSHSNNKKHPKSNKNKKKKQKKLLSGKTQYLLFLVLVIVNFAIYHWVSRIKSIVDNIKTKNDGTYIIKKKQQLKTLLSSSQEKGNNNEQKKQKQDDNNIDTTIIISTSLDLPNQGGKILPDAQQIINLLESIEKNVDGISIDQIPIIIAIDGQDNNDNKNIYDTNMKTLLNKYNNKQYSNIQILEGDKKYYLAGNLKRAIDLVTTKYVYVLYQQIPFKYTINHNKLIQSMKEFNPKNQLRCIKFLDGVTNANAIISHCTEDTFQHDAMIRSTTNDLKFYQSNQFFDSNQLTTKSYYKEMLNSLGISSQGTIAEPMSKIAPNNCTFWGQSIYPTHKDA